MTVFVEPPLASPGLLIDIVLGKPEQICHPFATEEKKKQFSGPRGWGVAAKSIRGQDCRLLTTISKGEEKVINLNDYLTLCKLKCI